MSDKKQIPGLPVATEAKDNDRLIKRDTDSGSDEGLPVSVLLERSSEQVDAHATEEGGIHGIPVGERALHSADLGPAPESVPTNSILGSEIRTPASSVIAEDGAWSWFGGPRAEYYSGAFSRTYLGYTTSNNDFVVASYDHVTKETNETSLGVALGGQDDHDAPAVLVLADGRIAAFYSDHSSGPIKLKVSSNPEDVSAFGAEIIVTGAGSHTYPYAAQLSGEDNRLYCFYVDRDNNRNIYYVHSDDTGATWSAPQQLINGRVEFSQGVYYQAFSDGDSRVDFCFTGAEGGGDDPKLDVRHAYFSSAGLFSAASATLGALPVNFDDLPVVYGSSNPGNHHAWVWDIAKKGQDVEIVYAAFPSVDRHQYRHALWDGAGWSDTLLCEAGSYISSEAVGSAREGYYSAGVSIDRANSGAVYACIGSNRGSNLVRLVRDGAQWAGYPYAGALSQNIRPVCPESANPIDPVFWVQGEYAGYQNWDTRIVTGSPVDRTSSIYSTKGVVRVYLSTGQEDIANDSTVPFDSVSYDSIDEADILNNGVTVKKTGMYSVSASLEASGTPEGVVGIKVYTDGNEVSRGAMSFKPGGEGAAASFSDVLRVRAGQTVTVRTRFGGIFTLIGNTSGVSTYLTVAQVEH